MSAPSIPGAMVEAAAKALDRFLIYDGSDDMPCDEEVATAVLAAALAVCTVDERWRAQAGAKPGAVAWSAYASDRAEMDEWAQVHAFLGPVTYQRWLSITTPAEQVDTEEAAP